MKKIVLASIIIVWGALAGIFVHGAQATELIADSYDINGYSIAYYENNKIAFQNYGNGIKFCLERHAKLSE